MRRPSVICIGTSAGGVTAIQRILEKLPTAGLPPVVIVQHLPESSRVDLDLVFGRFYKGNLIEADDKQPLAKGDVIFAPGGYHLLLEREGYVSLSQDEPVHFARPSIDVFFESAAWAFGDNALGVLLTGANADGAAGLKALHDAGAETIVQDPNDAEARAMPQAALQLIRPTYILPLDKIADYLSTLIQAEEVTL